MFIDDDDSKSDPNDRDSFTTILSPSLASHALNVNNISVSWCMLEDDSVRGIYNTIDSIIPSRYSSDMIKCDVFSKNASKITKNANIIILFNSIELRDLAQSSIYKIVASIKLSILYISLSNSVKFRYPRSMFLLKL